MTAHDAQTLMALRRLEQRSLGGRGFCDLSIARMGDEIFGGEWTSTRQGKHYGYAPLVSMSLGRLAHLDLVVKRLFEHDEVRTTFHVWTLNDDGRALADGLLGGSRS